MVLAGIYVLAWIALFGTVGWYLANQCGRYWLEGFILGGVLGPAGLFLLVLLPRGRHTEAEPIKRATDERQVSTFLEQLQ